MSQTNAYTPQSALQAVNYDTNFRTSIIRNLNWIISGFDILNGKSYFNWDNVFGDFGTRIQAYLAEKRAEGTPVKLWEYVCGRAGGYTYPNTLISNTGLQTKMIFWQSYQRGATGLLYYGTDFWDELKTGQSYVTMNVSYYFPANKQQVRRLLNSRSTTSDRTIIRFTETVSGITEINCPLS